MNRREFVSLSSLFVLASTGCTSVVTSPSGAVQTKGCWICVAVTKRPYPNQVAYVEDGGAAVYLEERQQVLAFDDVRQYVPWQDSVNLRTVKEKMLNALAKRLGEAANGNAPMVPGLVPEPVVREQESQYKFKVRAATKEEQSKAVSALPEDERKNVLESLKPNQSRAPSSTIDPEVAKRFGLDIPVEAAKPVAPSGSVGYIPELDEDGNEIKPGQKPSKTKPETVGEKTEREGKARVERLALSDGYTSAVAVYFPFDGRELDKSVKAEIANFVASTGGMDSGSWVLVGRADTAGPEGYNQKLSEARAIAVKRYLLEVGIDASLIDLKGVGEKGSTAAPQSRRVDIQYKE